MSEEQITPNNGSYSADSIQVLEGLEAVRKRPAMYIGDISIKGLHHLVYEIVDNSIDEALAGYCDHIEVTINEDNSITVQDNGRGIPVDYHEKEKKSALEVAMTVLHAGGKFDKGSYKVSGGLHGVGMSCVNALSTHMTTQVFRDGKIYQQEYEIGKPLYSVKEVGVSDITGTRQQFWPDDTIFTETVYDYKILASRLRELAYLNAGLRISLTDRRVVNEEDGSFKSEVFYSEEGLREFVRFIESSREHLINDVIYLNSEKQGIPIEIAIMYNTGFSENVHSYVNNINTIEGGTHLAGFRRALTRTLKKYAEDSKMLEKVKVEISGDDFREGLTAVISVKVADHAEQNGCHNGLKSKAFQIFVPSLNNCCIRGEESRQQITSEHHKDKYHTAYSQSNSNTCEHRLFCTLQFSGSNILRYKGCHGLHQCTRYQHGKVHDFAGNTVTRGCFQTKAVHERT